MLIPNVRTCKSVCPCARVYCHASHHLTLWTVRNVSLTLPLDTFLCQAEIINAISPKLALYSVNHFKMWLCLFISETWISERPLICLFHYTLPLCSAYMHVENWDFTVVWFWCSICKATKISCHVGMKKIHYFFSSFIKLFWLSV